MMPFLYKERQAKRKAASINGVVSTPDYSRTEPNAEIMEKMQREANKRAR